jgi:cytosine/adenosine deaminase-related metal-dependent hydrolase
MKCVLAPAKAYYEQRPEDWSSLYDRIAAAGSSARILLRGATVMSLDPNIGNFDAGDVLIDGNKIEAVGSDLAHLVDDEQTIVVDMKGMIVLPGIVDGHRHCWQNQFRRVIPDAELTEYIKTLHGEFALKYRPHDMYVGNFITMLTLLDAGVTCITDCSRNTRSKAHADAVFRSYMDSGIRAVHVGAPSSTGEWEEHLPEDLIRLRDQYCSGLDTLTTVRMGIDMRRVMPVPDLLKWAREHGFAIHLDGVMGQRCEEIVQLGREGLLGPDLTLIHSNDMPDEGWRMIAASGTMITVATTSEQQSWLWG